MAWGHARGFTLIELLVVLSILATLLSLVAPRYFRSLDQATEVVLRTNLKAAREAIDRFAADTGRPPTGLAELVAQRYLSEEPVDPVTQRRDTWVQQGVDCGLASCKALTNLHSGVTGRGLDGTAYSAW